MWEFDKALRLKIYGQDYVCTNFKHISMHLWSLQQQHRRLKHGACAL